MIKNLFGIMQGRLLPKYNGNYQAHPVGYWQDEFKCASNLGFDCIEFILDYNLANSNPLMNDTGLEEIFFLSQNYNVLVRSICADYFMDSPLFLDDLIQQKENLQTLKTLILNAYKLGVTDIVIPLVDNSSILSNKVKFRQVIKFFNLLYQENDVSEVNICLETDLPPKQFLELINEINRPQIKINYDTGNSASLGYNFYEEFEEYGHLVTNIHIKDRKLHGNSVALGLGDCNFKDIFIYLDKVNYEGIFILQAFRGDNGLNSTIPQHNYIKKYLNKHCNKKNF